LADISASCVCERQELLSTPESSSGRRKKLENVLIADWREMCRQSRDESSAI